MIWLIILGLVVTGIIFLLLEILVVPGVTISGLVGLALVITGVVLSFSHYGVEVGVLVLIVTLVASLLAIVLALRSRTWNKAMHQSTLEGRVNEVDTDKIKKGDQGMSVTRLNPMGKALIGDEYYEVSSKDNLIDENTHIEVVKVEGNKIIVKPKAT